MQKFHMAYPARFVRGSSFDTLATFTRKRHLKRKVDKVTPSLLLHQVNLVPKIRLLPSQSKLLSKYQSFLSLNFLESIEHELVNDGSEYHELNTILAKVYSQNESFAAYTDACLQTAELRQMLRTLDSRRKSSRMEKNLDKGTVVISDAVFELLCRHFAARNDWLSLEKTLNWLQEDGIAPTFNICLASLECIGGLLHLSVKGRAPPKALNNFLSAEERLLHSFLENKVIEVVSLAEKHGINVYSGLLRYPRRKYSLQKILTALLFATPDKQADISFHPATSQLSSSPTSAVAMRVSRALDRAVVSPCSP
uniref:RPOL_N domain-containing protein n=1 Tax=Mesocestoides corti TaxID=53468 RepID=A0A5K3FUR2_MESCO